ncbi:MAG TPA: GNAT family N-acetyltransferase [Anaerolineaceae bacterium]|jgi:ribosomal protein S18 acetylase RimI-like enzyme|nr:GNAT family N-acetyltransferase [Longilinea sp.]HNZ13931.1 GNAT family N-acetyltransferase [Anaerolineaceae bacterium]HOD04641.1 GNAT family N-acetyltransferase [Anaerolineaceae bacterium]HOG79765.1 GNAT family N-acetyltransferase [Anaerolineaceae bacterium]HQF61659.1 GNAT family N-acetyltransferase [Anaerolineaceae bacterium]
MPQIEIRPAVAEDIPLLVALDHDYETTQVWRLEPLTEDDLTAVGFREVRLPRPMRVAYPRTPQNLVNTWQRHDLMIVAVLSGEPVGYLTLSDRQAPNAAWVTDLVIAPSVRRQGIGSALLLASQGWAAQRNLRCMLAEMQTKNAPMIRMAQKLGYTFSGHHEHYYANQETGLFFTRFLK